jgi:hypothetical protein
VILRRAAIWSIALLAVVGAAACGSDSATGANDSSSSSPTVSTAPSANGYPFDATSAREFPGTSLDQRLHMAQEVCDSIKAKGSDNYVTWLNLSKTRNDLVSFSASPQILVAFSGLAVKAVCPNYLDQLQSALSGQLTSTGS